MKRALCMLLALAMLPVWTAAAETPGRALTIMVYMTGSDLESGYGAASADIQEMIKSGFDGSRVTLLVMVGGSRRWAMAYDPDKTYICELGERGMRILRESPALNMGDAGTLSMLLRFGVQSYPADEYALILWDHGGGPMEGVCYDERNDMDSLSLSELSGALADSPFGAEKPLDWIGFDACMMASIETACACSPFARYMIASQETEPSSGWNYGFLGEMGGDMDGGAIGEAIVNAYLDAAGTQAMLTLSCVDLHQTADVERAMDALFLTLAEQLDGDSFSTMANDRMNTKSFGRVTTLSDYDLVDLYDLAQKVAHLAPRQAAALQQALDAAVLCNGGNQSDACGLSVYSPFYNKYHYRRKWMEEYHALGFSSGYTRYMERYAGLWLGERLADWSLSSYGALPYAGGAQAVELTLTEEQMAHFAAAQVVILRDSGSGETYHKIFEIDGLRPDGFTLRADYDYSALYVVDETGQPVTDSYPFFTIDDCYYVHVVLESESMLSQVMRYGLDVDRAEDFTSVRAYLRCRLDEQSGELEVLGVIPESEDEHALGVGREGLGLDSEQWPFLFFDDMTTPVRLSRDADGGILPADDWQAQAITDYRQMDLMDGDGRATPIEQWIRRYSMDDLIDSEYHLWGEVDNRKPWSLRFLPRQFSGLDLYAQFIVTDTQGIEAATELIPLANPNLICERDLDVEILNRDGVEIRLSRLTVLDADLEKGVFLWLEARNDTDHRYSLSLYQPIVNNCGIQDYLHSPQHIEPRQRSRLYVRLPLDEIPALEDGIVHSLSFSPGLSGYADDSGTMESIVNGEEIWGDRVTVEPDIDVSALNPPRSRPDGSEPLGSTRQEGIRFDLLRLEEGDDGDLEGVAHLSNDGDADLCLYLSTVNGLPSAGINDHYLPNCLIWGHSVGLPVGGEAYLSFTLRRTPVNQRLIWHTGSPFASVDLFDYWAIDRVEALTLPVGVAHPGEGEESIRSVDVRIGLDRPLALNRRPEAGPASAPLLESLEVNMNLRQVEWSGGDLLLYADVCCENEMYGGFYVSACAVDGEDAEVEVYMDSTDDQTRVPSLLMRKGTERCILRLSAGTGALPEDFSRIDLAFGLSKVDEQPRHSSAATIVPRPGRSLSGGMADADAFDVTSAKVAERFDPQVVLPDAAGEYAVTLRAPLTAEQSAEIVQGWAFLALPREGSDELYDMLAFLYDPIRWNGSSVWVDYCGLVPIVRGAGSALPCQYYTEGDVVNLTSLGMIEVYGLQSGEGPIYERLENVAFELNPDEGLASLTGYRASGYPDDGETPYALLHSTVPVRIRKLADGSRGLPEIGVDDEVNYEVAVFSDWLPVVDFRPAKELSPVVVFFLQRADGSGASLIAPYPAR